MQGAMQVPIWPDTNTFGTKLFRLESENHPAVNLQIAPTSLTLALGTVALGVRDALRDTFLNALGIPTLGLSSLTALINGLSGEQNTVVSSAVLLANQCDLNPDWLTVLDQLGTKLVWNDSAIHAFSSWAAGLPHVAPIRPSDNSAALVACHVSIDADTTVGREGTSVEFGNSWKEETFVPAQMYEGWGECLKTESGPQVTVEHGGLRATYSPSENARHSFEPTVATPGELTLPDAAITCRLNLKNSIMKLCPAELFMPGNGLACLLQPERTFIQGIHHVVKLEQTPARLRVEALTLCEIAHPWSLTLSRPYSMFLNDRITRASLLISRVSDPEDTPLPIAMH